MRFTLMSCGALAVLVLSACGQASSPVERQEQEAGVEEVQGEQPQPQRVADLPAYDVLLEQDCSQDFPAKCYNVATDATSEVAFTHLTDYFRDENPEYLAVLVTFYEARQTADQTGAGFAFRDEETARSVLSSMYSNPAEASIDEQVRETMENDGIYVISFAEEAEDMKREVCAEWDVTTMGAPPAELNCPGY